jgi:hypothetical protein
VHLKAKGVTHVLQVRGCCGPRGSRCAAACRRARRVGAGCRDEGAAAAAAAAAGGRGPVAVAPRRV